MISPLVQKAELASQSGCSLEPQRFRLQLLAIAHETKATERCLAQLRGIGSSMLESATVGHRKITVITPDIERRWALSFAHVRCSHDLSDPVAG
jgi:hypothetical protein